MQSGSLSYTIEPYYAPELSYAPPAGSKTCLQWSHNASHLGGVPRSLELARNQCNESLGGGTQAQNAVWQICHSFLFGGHPLVKTVFPIVKTIVKTFPNM